MNNRNRKRQFMQAVRILAPDDRSIHLAAQRVPEEKLPAFPGGAALEFVVAMGKLRAGTSGPLRESRASESGTAWDRRNPQSRQYDDRFRPAEHPTHNPGRETGTKPDGMALKDALRVKSAEYWLKLGQPVQALMELEKLPKSALNHPWALRTHVAAMGAAREMSEMVVQA
jgi:hypothetical protein